MFWNLTSLGIYKNLTKSEVFILLGHEHCVAGYLVPNISRQVVSSARVKWAHYLVRTHWGSNIHWCCSISQKNIFLIQTTEKPTNLLPDISTCVKWMWCNTLHGISHDECLCLALESCCQQATLSLVYKYVLQELVIPTSTQDRGVLNLQCPAVHTWPCGGPRLGACEELKVHMVQRGWHWSIKQ